MLEDDLLDPTRPLHWRRASRAMRAPIVVHAAARSLAILLSVSGSGTTDTAADPSLVFVRSTWCDSCATISSDRQHPAVLPFCSAHSTCSDTTIISLPHRNKVSNKTQPGPAGTGARDPVGCESLACKRASRSYRYLAQPEALAKPQDERRLEGAVRDDTRAVQ